MKLYKICKTYIVSLLLIVYYCANLRTLTSATYSGYYAHEWAIYSSYAIKGLSVCAVLSVIRSIGLYCKKNECPVWLSIIKYPFTHLALVIPLIVNILIYQARYNPEMTGWQYFIPFDVFIICVAMADTYFENHIKTLFLVNVFAMVVIFILFNRGILLQVNNIRPDGRVRYAFGYIFPLDLHGHFVSIIFMYMYLRKKHFKFMDFATINALNVLLFEFTNARTDFIVIIGSTLILWLINLIDMKKIPNIVLGIVSSVIILVTETVPFVLTYTFSPSNSYLMKLNDILTGRLLVQNRVVTNEGISLFGKYLKWIGGGNYSFLDKEYNWIDNSILKDAVDYGWVFIVIFVLGLILLAWQLLKRKDLNGLVILVFFVLGSSIEYYTFLKYPMPILFMLSFILLKENKELLGFTGKKEMNEESA